MNFPPKGLTEVHNILFMFCELTLMLNINIASPSSLSSSAFYVYVFFLLDTVTCRSLLQHSCLYCYNVSSFH